MQGFRKPDPGAYKAALAHLGAASEDVVIVDDRPVNVEAAVALGMRGVAFKGAEDCRARLLELGVVLPEPTDEAAEPAAAQMRM